MMWTDALTKLRGLLANPWFRWVLSLIILMAILFFLRDHLDFLRTGLHEIKEANPVAVGIALVLICLSMYAMAEVMRIMLRAGGIKPTRRDTTALTLASNSWSATFPGGAAFSAILTFHVQRSWGASVVLCSWFFVLSSALSTVWLVALGILSVFFMGATLNIWSLVLSLSAMVGIAVLVYWASHNPERLAAWARSVLPRINRLRRKPADTGVDKLIEHISQLRSVTLSGSKFAFATLWSLLNRLFDVAALWVCVWAVSGTAAGFEPGPDSTSLAGILLAYTTAKIAGTLQATPGGIGPVEAAYIAALVATGMTAVDATGAVIIYRIISFILMASVGWIIYFLHFTPTGIRARELAEPTSDTME